MKFVWFVVKYKNNRRHKRHKKFVLFVLSVGKRKINLVHPVHQVTIKKSVESVKSDVKQKTTEKGEAVL